MITLNCAAMLTSTAPLNSGALVATAVGVPPLIDRCRLQGPHSLSLWSSAALSSKRNIISTTTAAGGSSWKTTTSVKTAVATVDSSGPAELQEATTKYYFVVANAKFMLDEEEHFKELMYERLRLFRERNMKQDFWLVVEPKFLDKFPNITKRLKRPAVALVSTNGPWITFMKLRLDRVLSESYEADSIEEALASNPSNLEFAKPEKWLAPYKKYDYGWWEPFLPPNLTKHVEA